MAKIGELERLRKGNMETVTEKLIEQHLPGVFQYVHSWVGSIETAEDLSLAALKSASTDGRRSDPDSVAVRVFGAARTLLKQRMQKSACRQGFECLSPQERDILSLKLDGELDNRTIGRLTGCSESAVGTMVTQCLVKLKKQREAEE